MSEANEPKPIDKPIVELIEQFGWQAGRFISSEERSKLECVKKHDQKTQDEN